MSTFLIFISNFGVNCLFKHELSFSIVNVKYTDQNYKRNTFVFATDFSWAELKDLRLFLCTQKPYFSGISRCWLDIMIIAQVCLKLATIKGHSKMWIFIAQHNATDVAIFEEACNWHADCRNVQQSCCPWIECSFLYHKPSPKAFRRIWQYIQPASQNQTTCNHTSPEPLHPVSSPPRSSETSHLDSCCNNRFA